PGPPQPSADILAGAVLSPFYDPRLHLRKRYDEGNELWSTPHWLPAHWHRFLIREGREREAEAHLAALDAAAAAKVPEASGGALPAATGHVIRRARVLGGVCRTRRLPDRWYCLFWPRVESVFRKHPPAGTPARLIEAMGLMEGRLPPAIGDYYNPAAG